MGMKALMSAAHAAGYAMAAEDLAECRTFPASQEVKGTALVVHTPHPLWSEAQAFLRRLWLRDWFAGHWHRGAAA